MNSRLHQKAERDTLFGPGIILEVSRSRKAAGRREAALSRAPEHGKPARANRFLAAHSVQHRGPGLDAIRGLGMRRQRRPIRSAPRTMRSTVRSSN